MNKLVQRNLLAALAAVLFCRGEALADDINITIVTEIRDVSILSFQVGVKSKQTIKINTSNNSISSKFETGVTNIAGLELNSVRDDFKVSALKSDGDVLSFSAQGTTASKASFFGDIDYQYDIRLDRRQLKVWITGCHNEFPSYQIKVNKTVVYDRKQTGTAVLGLAGTCDIKVNEKSKKY